MKHVTLCGALSVVLAPLAAFAGPVPVTNGLQLQLDAGVSTSVLDAEGDAAGTANFSGSVATWQDQSGQNNHATQTTSTARPTYGSVTFNSKPALGFDGSSDFLSIADTANLELNGDSTVFVVARYNDTATATQLTILSKDNGSSPGAYTLFRMNDRKLEVDRPFVQGGPKSTATVSSGAPHQIATRISGTGLSYFVDGAAGGTGSLNGGTATNTPLRIGTFGGNNWWLLGDVAEVLVYNRALTTGSSGEFEQVTAYLNEKWIVVPEPSSAALVLLGLAGLAGARGRHRSARA